MPEFFFHVGIDLHRADGAATDHIRQRFSDVARVVEESDADEDGSSASSETLQGSPFSHRGSRPEDDCRAGELVVRSVDMGGCAPASSRDPEGSKASTPPKDRKNSKDTTLPTGVAAEATLASFDFDSGDETLGWGVIRLYREREEATPLASVDDCCTLCVLAVPSYMTPSDFLGFVGEDTRAAVSHFRMLRTERINRYMVLMRFRSGRKANAWRREWNGKPFNDMESENCHVVFVRSIKFRAPPSPRVSSFPKTANDPFAPSQSLSTRPMAPPTPALKELPTCPVCLERMDESTGLLTILCRHVFHCSCLQKWRGSGCPVCRFTQDADDGPPGAPKDGEPHECSVCRSDVNLWVCLICGNVGCGRYDGAHAFAHHQATTHPFAMDMVTHRVWDYAEDGYVHRILQSKTDGKLLELPSIPASKDRAQSQRENQDTLLPAEKLDALSLEYSYLLTKQLDSQRLYFEEKLERAADKASSAAEDARDARAEAETFRQQLEVMRAQLELLKKEDVQHQKEKDKVGSRADRFEVMARKMEHEWREEKAVAEGLKERVEHLDRENKRLVEENLDLKEQNRDLGFFISGQQKLEGLGLGEEVTEGKVEVPEQKKKKGKKR